MNPYQTPPHSGAELSEEQLAQIADRRYRREETFYGVGVLILGSFLSLVGGVFWPVTVAAMVLGYPFVDQPSRREYRRGIGVWLSVGITTWLVLAAINWRWLWTCVLLWSQHANRTSY